MSTVLWTFVVSNSELISLNINVVSLAYRTVYSPKTSGLRTRKNIQQRSKNWTLRNTLRNWFVLTSNSSFHYKIFAFFSRYFNQKLSTEIALIIAPEAEFYATQDSLKIYTRRLWKAQDFCVSGCLHFLQFR